MSAAQSRFSVALDDSVSADAARAALELLADKDSDFRDRVKSDPSVLSELGLVLGDGVWPDTVILPTRAEVKAALDVIDAYGEFRFHFEPFGFYTPAKNPFIGILLLAARVNAGG